MTVISTISPAALPVVVCVLGCVFIYLKIQSQRKVTKEERDNTNEVVSNEQLYEGLICLDVKLTKLVEIMDKLYSIAEMKQTGGRNTLNR